MASHAGTITGGYTLLVPDFVRLANVRAMSIFAFVRDENEGAGDDLVREILVREDEILADERAGEKNERAGENFGRETCGGAREKPSFDKVANAYGSKSLTEIENDLHILATVAKPGDVYGLDAEDLGNLSAHAAGLAAVATALVGAVAAEKAARQARDAALAQARTLLQGTATFIYSRSPASDAQLAAVNLAPRRSGSVRPYVAARVTGLIATPFADGTVKLAWDRGSNPKSGTFVVETSPDGQDWTYPTSTGRITFLAEGFAPGVAAWFRVTAKTAASIAVPSASVSVYAPEAARVELRLAA